MKGIKELGEEVLLAWSKGANIAFPDKEVRSPWMCDVSDLAKYLQQGVCTTEDIEDYTREICSDPWKRGLPQLWSLKFIKNNIAVWVQVANRKKSFAPPPDFMPHVDHLGRTHSWDWVKGREIVVEAMPRREPEITATHGLPYVPMAPNERLTKRQGREGYSRDFFLTGNDSELSEEEIKQITEMIGQDE